MSEHQLGNIDIFSKDFRRDPYPVYRQLRADRPVAPAGFIPGAWLVSRFADCSAILRSEGGWSSDERNTATYKVSPAARMRPGAQRHAARLEPFVKMDPPDHTRLRQLVSPWFTPRAVKKHRPHVEAIATTALEQAVEVGGGDIIEQFADLLPLVVIADLLGVPEADVRLLGHWSRELG